MPYQGTYMYPTQSMQQQIPAYGSQTPNAAIQKPPAMSGRVYGTMVFDASYSVLGDDAVSIVSREYEMMVA